MWCGARLPDELRLGEADKTVLRGEAQREAAKRRRNQESQQEDLFRWIDNSVWWPSDNGGGEEQ